MKPQSHSLELEDRIDLYVKGALTQSQIDDLWVDIIQNDSLDYLKTVATVRTLSAGKNVAPIPLSRPERSRMIAAAAAAAVVIGIGTSLYLMTDTNSGPVFSPLTKIEYSLLRSSTGTTEAFGSRLEALTIIALEGDPAQANVGLTQMLAEPLSIDQRVAVIMNLSALQFNEGELDAALFGFQSILDSGVADETLLEKTAWYAANASIRLNRNDEAARYLDLVISANGVYKRAAVNARDQLPRP